MTIRDVLAQGGASVDKAGEQAGRAWRQLMLRPRGLYGAAAIRIGVAGLFLLHLLREAPHADRLWGPGSPYSPGLFREASAATGFDDKALSWWYTWLVTDSGAFFWTMYVLAAVVSLLYALGWHTRVMAVLFAFLVVAFYHRAVPYAGGYEFLTVLFANYLVLCASGRRWSLDARRPRRPVRWGEAAEELRRRAVTVLHNAGLALLAFQVMVIYTAAAMYKVQGPAWRDGTALYYILHLEPYTTWPALSHWVAAQSGAIAVLAYATVFSQLFFAALVFTRRIKYVLLAVMLCMHLGIGLLMALPWFSAITVVGDLVFLPTVFWLRLAALVRLARSKDPGRPEPAEEPAHVSLDQASEPV